MRLAFWIFSCTTEDPSQRRVVFSPTSGRLARDFDGQWGLRSEGSHEKTCSIASSASVSRGENRPRDSLLRHSGYCWHPGCANAIVVSFCYELDPSDHSSVGFGTNMLRVLKFHSAAERLGAATAFVRSFPPATELLVTSSHATHTRVFRKAVTLFPSGYYTSGTGPERWSCFVIAGNRGVLSLGDRNLSVVRFSGRVRRI